MKFQVIFLVVVIDPHPVLTALGEAFLAKKHAVAVITGFLRGNYAGKNGVFMKG